MTKLQKLKIGTGAGYEGDRIDPAKQLAKHEPLDYLVFECLAERTIANAQRRILNDSGPGYSPLLPERMHAVLEDAQSNDIRIISNMGAASPEAARERTIEVATDMGLSDLSVASVAGSDVTDNFEALDEETFDGEPVEEYEESCFSASAYLGVEGIVQALRDDVDVILTGRVADPSLFLAPMLYEHGWDIENPDTDPIGQGVACAHLMECAGQVTGGYYPDPGYKDVNGLARLGFPIAEIEADGAVTITKLPNTGGEVTVDTAREQILYEVHDPSGYLTPDCVADFSELTFEQVGEDRVAVSGGQATSKPDTFKVNIGYRDSFMGEGQISYGGPGARERAELAGDIVKERLDASDIDFLDFRVDLMGIDSLHGEQEMNQSSPYEVRLRVAGKCETRAQASRIAREVQTLYTNGPAGGGGATMNTKLVLGIVSTLIDREHVQPVVITSEV